MVSESVAAEITGVVEAGDVFAIGRSLEHEEWIEAMAILAADDLPSLGIEEDEGGVEGRSGAVGLEVEDEFLAGAGLEAVVIEFGPGGDPAIDTDGELEERGGTRLSGSFGFDDFGEVGDLEGDGIGDTAGAGDAQFLGAKGGIGSHDDLEGEGAGGIGGPDGDAAGGAFEEDGRDVIGDEGDAKGWVAGEG
jgi:hypothetical protein